MDKLEVFPNIFGLAIVINICLRHIGFTIVGKQFVTFKILKSITNRNIES